MPAKSKTARSTKTKAPLTREQRDRAPSPFQAISQAELDSFHVADDTTDRTGLAGADPVKLAMVCLANGMSPLDVLRQCHVTANELLRLLDREDDPLMRAVLVQGEVDKRYGKL